MITAHASIEDYDDDKSEFQLHLRIYSIFFFCSALLASPIITMMAFTSFYSTSMYTRFSDFN